jgi:(E)-4-hydroxy-3-methylbut-2-enyl-diphosphate synthase
MKVPRANTHPIHAGTLQIGGGAPVVVQSMLNTSTSDVAACLAQIGDLQSGGCELVRVAIPDASVLDAFAQICEQSPLPVVADIHFDHNLAIAAAERGAAKLRINPGNIGTQAAVDAVIDAAGEAGIPIRIGVNAGSLESNIAERTDLDAAAKLVASALGYVEHFQARGFKDIVLSAKAHDVATTIAAYRALAAKAPTVPLHLGVTEAGTLAQGTVKSALGIGTLLLEGIGDTFRVSLTADVREEVKVAWELLKVCGLRARSAELVSCPTCARCEVDLIAIANEVERRLDTMDFSCIAKGKPPTVAVMGCIVNGPGEARDADFGVACGKSKGAIFSQGQIIKTVPENQIIDTLIAELACAYPLA